MVVVRAELNWVHTTWTETCNTKYMCAISFILCLCNKSLFRLCAHNSIPLWQPPSLVAWRISWSPIWAWWSEATTNTAFSTSSGSTSASLEVLSTQKVSLEEICFCCFHQHFLFAVTFSTKKSSPLPTTTAGGEKTWKQTYVMNNKFLQTFVINFKIWTSTYMYQGAAKRTFSWLPCDF